jgi:multidrug efflux pump subunit AcrA (membrane-fusion protein)
MKLKQNFGQSVAFVVVLSVALLAGCSKKPDSDETKPAADASDKGTPDKAAAEAKPGVTVDAETQGRIGLKLETPAPAQWLPETKVYGQVLDPAPLTDQAMELNRAEITLDSSRQELERAKQLKAGNNISARAFLDAQTVYSQNLADVQALRFKIQTAWGRKIADMMGPVETAPGSERKTDKFLEGLREATVLIRVNLPPGERMESQGQTARIVSLGGNNAPVTATCFDLLPTLDAQTQQQGVLFTADQAAGNRLIPGEAVTAFIKTPGEPISGVVVPASAVLRHEGRGWVYVQTETNQFLRAEVPLDRTMDGGWFVSENLSATNHIVTSGAQTVLSAELSGGAFTTGERD